MRSARAVPTSAAPEVVDADVEHVQGLLARCSAQGPWQPVLAGRLGQLHARRGDDLHELLACVDETLVVAGRGPAAPHVAHAALDAWAGERARQGRGADDPLTGLPGADGLQHQLDAAGSATVWRVLVAEVVVDEHSQRRRGVLRDVESDLSLALVRAVLDDGLRACGPWSRLGAHRLGTVVDDGEVIDLATSVGRARRWLARWRDDVDVAAWLEPVPTDPSARGALVRDLAM